MKSLIASTLILCSFALPAIAATPKEMQESMLKMQQEQAKIMQSMMQERQSPMSVSATIEAIKRAGEARGWRVSRLVDVQENMRKAGVQDVKAMKIIDMCHPGLTTALIVAQQTQSPPTPACPYNVYETPEGKTHIMHINTTLMSQMANGAVAQALTNLANEENAMFAAALKR